MKRKLKRKFRKNKLFLVALCVIVSFVLILNIGYSTGPTEKIHFLSLSEGDGIIIESNGHYGLIDAATPSTVDKQISAAGEECEVTQEYGYNNGTKIKSYAQALGVEYFDFVIITHHHWDHNGGIPEVKDLFDDRTIAFFKEDLTTDDDYEEELNCGTWKNHWYYEQALQAFDDKNVITCDVTKASLLNDSLCNLSTLNNSFISSVSYDKNDAFISLDNGYNTKVKENLYFDFGDFRINLYSLYNYSYHSENTNSIVTLVTDKKTGAKAALTGDIDTVRGDIDGPEGLIGRSHFIENPVGDCGQCISKGIENQISDVIGEVDILKSAHHGLSSSNSKYALDKYKPAYYITQGIYYASMENVYPSNSSNMAAITYLKNKYHTKSYYASQAGKTYITNGALVAEFNDINKNIAIKDYNYNGEDTGNVLKEMGDYYVPNGWGELNNLYTKDKVWIYIENNHPVINDWLFVTTSSSDNSIGERYHFDAYGLMQTGLYNDVDGNIYYLSERQNTIGKMQTGWQNIDGELYYFRTAEDDISEGPIGSMVTGFVSIEEYKYYLRQSDHDISDGKKGSMFKGFLNIDDDTYYFIKETDTGVSGPTGSALTNGCVQYQGQSYCFNSEGVLTSGLRYIISDVDETDNYIINDINTEISRIGDNVILGPSFRLDIDYIEKNGKQILYTGGKTKIYKGMHIAKEYTNVIMGDTNGDGGINYLDYVKVYNHIQKVKKPNSDKKLLTGSYLLAADMSKDNTINYLDYVRIYNKIKELKGGKK